MLVWTWWGVCVCATWMATPAAGVVGGGPAAAPEPDAAVVFVQRDGRIARLQGLSDDKLGYYSFLGIRYAEPPVGQRRFQRPVRRRLAGEMATTHACAACPQPDPRASNGLIGREDCLCLNVYAPKMPGDEKGSPVVFFIHGGNYRSGSAAYYGGQHLAQKDTILVTAQYRLAALGFLSTGERDAAGNAGLFDLHAALQWVYEYIEFFGGDASRVIVMGQGSGASAASLLALAEGQGGKGREGGGVRGVAALSGAPLSPGAVRSDPARHAAALAKATGCPRAPAEAMLACLRKMPADRIVQADEKTNMNAVDTDKFLEEISGKSGAGARVEGKEDLRGLPPLVEESPSSTLQRRAPTYPLFTGVTSAETSRAVFGKYSSFLKDKLSSVRDFIKKEVVGGLRGVVAGVGALLPLERATGALPIPDYYQALFDNSMNTVDGLAQIAEATADALFNFPAYQSASLWSKGAPAYLYSFEHSGNLTKGAHFLPGVPLADSNVTEYERERTAAGPAHGDELAYIFEPLDAEGKPGVAGDGVSQTDARVRDSFVSLIARFAHDLPPVESKNTLQFLSSDSEPFIKIGQEVKLDKDFRFCQMGMWGNMADRLSGVLCKNIVSDLLNKLPPVKLPINALPLPATVPKSFFPNIMGATTSKITTITSKQATQVTPKLPVRLPFRF